MKRIFRISHIGQISNLLCLSRGSSSTLKTLTPFCFTLFRSPIHSPFHEDVLITKVFELKRELLRYSVDSDKVASILEGFLIQSSGQGDSFVELLRQLRPCPALSQVVFSWRRNNALGGGVPLTADEYAKGITIYGRLKNVEMAVLLFNESAKTTSVYNALMGAYMWNGLAEQCKKLFVDFKAAQGVCCAPSVATYNILISVYGRLIMVDRMEAVFLELQQLKISPDSSTYNNLIAGYIYAWKWEKMEETFEIMKNGFVVKPTLSSHLLMLRGYANSGNLLKMEEMYEAVKHHVDRKEIKLIESMICAYYRSSDKDRITKIKTLSKLIPMKSYKPWMYVLLIQVYGQDGNLHAMENFIDQAITKGLHIETDGIMRSIVASYFRCNAVDKLARFVRRAQSAGWRMSRSLFHGMMLMYGSQKRFKEMEAAFCEMESCNISRSKKSLCILHRVYTTHGQEFKVNIVEGMMLKHGHDFSRDNYLKL